MEQGSGRADCRLGATGERIPKMKLIAAAALAIAVMSAPAFAGPHAGGQDHAGGQSNGQGAENRSPVASATLAAHAAGINIGQTISDRNTNPDNTYYEDNGFTGRGDEVSTLAHTKIHRCHTDISVTGNQEGQRKCTIPFSWGLHFPRITAMKRRSGCPSWPSFCCLASPRPGPRSVSLSMAKLGRRNWPRAPKSRPGTAGKRSQTCRPSRWFPCMREARTTEVQWPLIAECR